MVTRDSDPILLGMILIVVGAARLATLFEQ